MNTILLPTDFSDNAFNAIKYAMAFFKGEPSRFLLIHAYEEPHGSAGMLVSIREMMKEGAQQDLEGVMEKITSLAPEKHHQFEALAVYGSTTETIIDMAKNKRADMIVMGTQGASGLKERFIGSNTADLIRKASCPIIAVPENVVFERPDRIALATDFLPISDPEILTPLLDIVQHFKTHLMVVHAHQNGVFNADTGEVKESVQLQEQFKFIHDSYHYIKSEDPLKSIAGFIEENNVNMLAMITRNHSFYERIFHPSSVEKMAFHTQIPLLAIHN